MPNYRRHRTIIRQDGGAPIQIGRMKLKFLPSSQIGEISGNVLCYCENRVQPVLQIRAEARIVPTVELLPSEIRLPRYSASGRIFSAMCVCRSRTGTEFELIPTEVPKVLTVSIRNFDGTSGQKLVTVELLDQQILDEDSKSLPILFIAKSRDKETQLPLVVKVERDARR